MDCDPAHAAERADLMQMVDDVAAKLSPKSLEVLKLRYVEQLPVSEIAFRTGYPAGAVYKKLQRAMSVFRHALKVHE